MTERDQLQVDAEAVDAWLQDFARRETANIAMHSNDPARRPMALVLADLSSVVARLARERR